MTETKTDWYIIVNPHAGSGKTMAAWAVAEKRLAELDIPYAVTYTGYKSHAKELAWDAARNGYRRILAVGGDGSVHEIFTGVLTFCEVEGVPSEEFYLGVIPIGSGNDWIKSYGIPHDTLKVVDLLSRSVFTQQDVVRVKSAGDKVCYMANIGGVGFDSHVCERVNAKKERGHRSRRIYINALISTLFGLKRFHAELSGDGEVYYSGPCYSVAFGNGRYSGGGMLQTAGADVNDGLLDVLIVPVIPVFRILKEIHRVFDGSTPESDAMIYRRCKCLRMVPLNARSSDIIEIDGEIEGRIPLEISLSGSKLNVLSGE